MSNITSFKIGDSVVVKAGVTEEDTKIDMSGWQGRVVEVDTKEDIVVVDWDSITLRNMPPSYIQRCEEEGYGWTQYYLLPSDIEPATARDSEEDVEEAIEELSADHEWEYLGEEGQAIQAVLQDVDPDDEMALLDRWGEHLGKALKFPFEAKVDEWQERGPLRSGDKVRVRKISEVDDHYGILVDVQSPRGHYVFPLCDLATVDENSPNHDPLQLYRVWFANR
jgi:Calcium binding